MNADGDTELRKGHVGNASLSHVSIQNDWTVNNLPEQTLSGEPRRGHFTFSDKKTQTFSPGGVL